MEIQLTTDAARQAGSRSRMYALLSRGFAFPSEALFNEVAGGSYRSHLQEVAGGLPYDLKVAKRLGNEVRLSYEALQASYIAQFDLGGPEGPAVPLYEGHYGGGRLRDMEEVLRLYHHFGFRYRGEFRPDHLQTELEFLHALTFGEAAASEGGRESRLYRQAEKDFLQYHLADLAAQVAKGLQAHRAPLYPDLARLLAAFVEKDAALLAGH